MIQQQAIIELVIYMRMYPHDQDKRQRLAQRVASVLPDMQRVLTGTTVLAMFEAWLQANGVVVAGSAPAPVLQPGTWREVLRLSFVLAHHWLGLIATNPKEVIRRVVWRMMGF